jgi:hypothetical protein
VGRQDDTNADAHVALGAALANTRAYEEALKQLETALVVCVVCVDWRVVCVDWRYLRQPRVCLCVCLDTRVRVCVCVCECVRVCVCVCVN